MYYCAALHGSKLGGKSGGGGLRETQYFGERWGTHRVHLDHDDVLGELEEQYIFVPLLAACGLIGSVTHGSTRRLTMDSSVLTS